MRAAFGVPGKIRGDMAGPELSQLDDASERRATVRLKRYWMSLRRVGIAPPAWRDFDPRLNPVPWEHCFIVTAGSTSGELLFDHIGRSLWIGLPGPVLVGAEGHGVPAFLAQLIAHLDTVHRTGQPA